MSDHLAGSNSLIALCAHMFASFVSECEGEGDGNEVYIFQNHTAYNGGGPMMGYCQGVLLEFGRWKNPFHPACRNDNWILVNRHNFDVDVQGVWR